jgi:hypothetical protein
LFQLINPLWLFAIGGISIPLIIHLWNIKKGKTLKIGSISLLGESSRQSARSLKLIDLLLLFLRCLLLIILALILAGPLWNSKINTSANKGWILIEKQNLKETSSQFKKEIDSLSKLGYEFHFFEPGFQFAKLEDALNQNKSEISAAQLLPYWSLIQLLEDEIPENTQVFLFTPNLLNRLGTKRPLFTHPIEWKTYTPSDSITNWIENAWFNESDSINVTIAASSPNKTTFETVTIDPASNNSPFEFNIQNGKASLKFKDKKQGESLPVTIDTATIRIAIYTDKFKNDARYLKAALSAIKKYTSRKINLTEYSTINIPSGQNIIFWLSETAIPSKIAPLNLFFKYEKGNIEVINSKLNLSPSMSSIEKEDIKLFKRNAYSENSTGGFSVWEDGFGKPILDLKMENKLSVFHFYSRFNPDWNELVWSNDFAKALIPIIIPDQDASEIHPSDKRIVRQDQIVPSLKKESDTNAAKNQESQKSLENQFWLALISIFVVERYLTFRNNLS